jgi:hypothetical protein
METNTSTEPNLTDLISEFDFLIDENTGVASPAPAPEKKEAPSGAADGPDDGGNPESKNKGGVPATGEPAAGSNGTDDDEDDGGEAKPAPATKAPTGKSNSFYAGLAKKYLEKGRWSKDLAIEDADGNQIPIEEVEDLNEETFFQIEEAVQAEQTEKLEKEYIPVANLDERKKKVIEIVRMGGDLAEIFKTPEQLNNYTNAFAGLDLDNEKVQETVYRNALIQYQGLDAESAQVLVDKAKADFTLDQKAKDFVDRYNKKFDEFVESKTAEIKQRQEDEKKQLAEFKKELSNQYKQYGLSDTLVKSLTSAAVTKKDDGFEIDSVYEEKMQDPKEAAELVLFLKDKKAYLEMMMKDTKVGEQIKTRKVVKMIPSKKTSNSNQGPEGTEGEDEFSFEVEVPK